MTKDECVNGIILCTQLGAADTLVSRLDTVNDVPVAGLHEKIPSTLLIYPNTDG